ncbi:MAG: putative diguanylate cyclase AdrA [bacterium ADurb.Bin243]|nr:MAG: putative diguanylate cyclase AdrA [bacterium ADurb.Bin243]
MSRNSKNVLGRLKSVFNNLKRVEAGLSEVIYFTAPPGRISAAEAEVRAYFYPESIGTAFISLLNGINLKDALGRGECLVIKKPGRSRVHYVLYDAGGDFYALALDQPQEPPPFQTVALRTALTLCLGFYETEISASRDAMTGLFNHGYFQRELRSLLGACEAEFEAIRENDAPLGYNLENSNIGLILFDIDNFKNFNDTFGHRMGDIVIEKVAEAAADEVSKYAGDLTLARYGGEEFAVITRGLSAELAVDLAEAIRSAVEAIDTSALAKKAGISLKPGRVTISLGAAFYEAGGIFSAGAAFSPVDVCASELIKKADLALYGSKHLGKNRVTLYDELPFKCASVIERKGDFILVNVGSAHGVDYNDSFEVYDGVYNGSTDVVNGAASKKIGCYPRLLKGVIRVSKNYGVFDSTLMEKIAVCEIDGESLPIAAGDICVPVDSGEREIYSGDVFLPREIFASRYACGPSLNADETLSGFRHLIMIDFKSVIDAVKYSAPLKFGQAVSEVETLTLKSGLKYERLFRLSSDKTVMCFKDEIVPEKVERFAAGANARLKAFAGEGAALRVSVLNTAALNKVPLCDGEILKYLRMAGFVNRYYKNASCIEEFDYQTCRRYGLFYYYRSRHAEALDIFARYETAFRQPPDFRFYQNAGVVALKTNKTGLAIKYFMMAEKLDGASPIPKSNLALIYSTTGAYDKAARYYAQCLELEPQSALYNNNMAYTLLTLGKNLKYALKCSKKAVENCSAAQLPEFLDTLGEIHMRLKNYGAAAAAYKKALCSADRPSAPEPYLKLARASLMAGEKLAAVKIIEMMKTSDEFACSASEIAEFEKIIDKY